MKHPMIFAFAALLAASLIACSDRAQSEGAMVFDIAGPVPVLIDRGILTDVLSGMDGEYPQHESCIAGSKLVFDADINPITIKKNNVSEDSNNISPAVITSSLNVTIYADDEGRSDSCPAEDVAYIISASNQTPIDVRAALDGCPRLDDIATDAGAPFPTSGVVIATLEGIVINEVVSGNCDDAESTDCVTYARNSFQIMIQECRP